MTDNSAPRQHPPLFCLKFNRISAASMRCLKFWIAICEGIGADFVLVCDLPDDALRNFFGFYFPGKAIKIIRTPDQLRIALASKLTPRWLNAGAAHFATFFYAAEQKVSGFWNIDADDTFFFHEPQAVAKKLLEIQDYAERNAIDCFSLDMYQTHQRHWSFGVSYIRTQADYFGILAGINAAELEALYPARNAGQMQFINGKGSFYPGYSGNVDWYFTYMRDKQLINAKSFYIDQSYFAHAGMFLYDDVGFTLNGVYHWKNNRLWDDEVAPDCIAFTPLF